MGPEFDPALFDDATTPEGRRALEAMLARDPELAAALARWQQVRGALRERLAEQVPDRRLLVLYALAAGGREEVLTDEERALLEEAQPRLAVALAEHPALADVVRRMQQEAEDFEAVWAEQTTPSHRRDRPARPRPRARRWVWRVSVAASLVLFAVVATLLARRDTGLVTLRTAPDEVRLVALADGSTVRLMGGSELTYPEGPFARRVRLTGRAFFDVTHNGEGFAVETPTALTTVLGTQFGVQAGDEATEVVLVSGRVALAPRAVPEQFVVLEPGQMSRVAAGARPATPVAVDLSAALAWTGQFFFRATPLPEALAQLSDHYGVPVTYTPALADEAISGTFEHEQPLEEILQALAAALGAEVRRQGTGYVLAR